MQHYDYHYPKMSFGLPVKEQLARVIGNFFSTEQIVNIFADANIHADKSLYAKWRIVLDAFGKMSAPDEAIPHILESFAHPLNFADAPFRKIFVDKLNEVLAYAKLEMHTTDKDAQVLGEDGFPYDATPPAPKAPQTTTDYVVETIKFFKDEYNKVRISGLTYEYPLRTAVGEEGVDRDYTERLKALEQLQSVGFITTYKIDALEDAHGDHWYYAICKIDESKLTQKEEPKATAAGAEAIAQKVIHEHTHRFENSIQEKGIDLNHKFDEQKPTGFYITKKEDDFWYKGRCLNLSKNTDYNQVFAALYAKLPEGGEVSYADLATEIESRLFKAKGKSADDMRKFIQRNLTDRSNGFVRYASIPETEDNGKPLIEVVRNSGVRFNNKAG